MKRLISAVLLSAAVVVPTMAKNAKTLGNGYPFTQVPPTFSTMQRYIKNPNLRKEKRYFFFIAAPMCLF